MPMKCHLIKKEPTVHKHNECKKNDDVYKKYLYTLLKISFGRVFEMTTNI